MSGLSTFFFGFFKYRIFFRWFFYLSSSDNPIPTQWYSNVCSWDVEPYTRDSRPLSDLRIYTSISISIYLSIYLSYLFFSFFLVKRVSLSNVFRFSSKVSLECEISFARSPVNSDEIAPAQNTKKKTNKQKIKTKPKTRVNEEHCIGLDVS